MSERIETYVNDWHNRKIKGITSVCSSHPWVLKTSLKNDFPLIIESTCNQVNQFGGYTGMKPHQFSDFIMNLAEKSGKPQTEIILGGDHLGPSPWQAQPAQVAMNYAKELIKSYVQAGYTKIHLDASMPLGDDESKYLDISTSAERTAELAKTAEMYKEKSIFYVIGTEVPIPGGAQSHKDEIRVTPLADAQQTILKTKKAFFSRGLGEAWDRVIAVVVQPGVEFGNDFIQNYESKKAQQLSKFIRNSPLVFEAHSTDYQTPENLKQLVKDGFEILKVGPALTFAYREAIFILSWIEEELFPYETSSKIIETVDRIMLENPDDWKKHYKGSKTENGFARKFSFSDRIRYYWFYPEVMDSLNRLMGNLSSVKIPLSLLSQYVPLHYQKVRSGESTNTAEAVIEQKISQVLDDYNFACQL